MSTEYYDLAEPFSSIRLDESGPHVRVTLWEAGANVGTLTLTRDGATAFLRLLADRQTVRASTSYGGADRGCVVTADPGLRDELQVISEYGELKTLAEVHALAGKGKA